MSSFPGSPRLLKGALISAPTLGSLPVVIPFQYNPETLSRTVTANSSVGATSTAEVLRLKGPPTERIQLEIQLDAADQLDAGSTTAANLGISPMLAALEVLLYPLSARMIANEVMARLGAVEIIAPKSPLCLFAWGPYRILPVRISELTIAEEAFDANLNPIRAHVSLAMQVLNYQDLGLMSTGGAVFMSHQIMKEALAAQSMLVGGGDFWSTLAGGARFLKNSGTSWIGSKG